MYVEAIISFVVLFVGIIIVAIAYSISKKADFSRDDDPKAWTTIIVGLISLPFVMIGSVEVLRSGIGKLINPEFYAIEFFINLVK